MLFSLILIISLGLAAIIWFALTNRITDPIDGHLDRMQPALPGINCGGCGFPCCHDYSLAITEKQASLTLCTPGGPKTAHALADIMGVEITVPDSLIAVVHCKGGNSKALSRSTYMGPKDCHAALLSGNGTRICDDGCLGLGSCVVACPLDAISITTDQVAWIDADKCSGCRLCVDSCPRSIISLIPRLHKIFLACSNHDSGSVVSGYCSVGCTACALCQNAAPLGAIDMVNNLPILDYTASEIFVASANRCPSKCFTDLAKARPKANIDVKCDGCADCVSVCPVNAINGQHGERHVIEKSLCIGCGKCVGACHVRAISLWGSLGYREENRNVKSWRKRK